MTKRHIAALSTVAVLFAAPASAQDFELGDPATGEKVFRQCMACHAVGEGAANKIGPELNELFGRVPGSLPDFQYSDAMVEYGKDKVWTAALLDEYLAAPRKVVPGTKMAYPGLRKEDDRAHVIAYLAQFDPEGAEVAQ